MKRALRILVPLALFVAVIASVVWYFMVYDRDFTRDMLLSQARRSESSGHHQVAAWLYDLAYEHASQDEDVAIELAQQYEKAGNYTKAEYTLYQAISDGGSAKLYTERSRIFVAQDKLMDAVNMLDTIDDPDIRSQLQQMRPSSPITNKEPGFHNQYLSVELSSTSGTVYATTDGSYPSTLGNPCTEPIELKAGETTIYALTVGENGLVSPLTIFSYTIGGIVEPVKFADPAFEAAVREQLTIGERTTIYTDELWDVREFTIPEGAATYSDLQYFPYLTKITVEFGLSDQLQYLTNLTSLQEITLVGTPCEQYLDAIAVLPDLTRLTMIDCRISSISALAAAENLEYLNLGYNSLRNLSPLAGCQNLQELHLSHNIVTDLSPISNCTQLRILDVSYNSPLAVIDPICGIPTLQELNISNNKIVSLGNIGDLALLTKLDCQNNLLTSISGVEKCSQLQHLNLANNQVVDILPLSALKQLTHLNFANNVIAQIPAFSKDHPLVSIDGSSNMLITLEELAGLDSLNFVFMDNNAEIESAEPLKECHCLIQVNLFGTAVADVSFLLEQDIIVNYDPTLAAKN